MESAHRNCARQRPADADARQWLGGGGDLRCARATAADLCTRETDNRGVAIVPLSETGRDISIETPGAARVRLINLKPVPHTIERTRRSPPSHDFWLRRRRGGDLALRWRRRRHEGLCRGLAGILDKRAITVIDGGIEPTRPCGRRQCGGRTDGQSAARHDGSWDTGLVRALDSRELPLGKRATRSKRASARPRPVDLPVESATTSRGSKSHPNAQPASCSCSTNAGAGAVSASSPVQRRIPRSVAGADFLSCAGARPSADVRLAERGSPGDAISQFIVSTYR